jgi:hypothetical protein
MYRTIQLDLLPTIEQQMSEFNVVLEKTSIEGILLVIITDYLLEDYKEIVEANKKEDETPIEYVPFKVQQCVHVQSLTLYRESIRSNLQSNLPYQTQVVQNPAFLPKLLRKSWQMSNKRLVQ